MANIRETVQKPIPTCDKHSSDEVEIYCKECSKAICFDCYKIDHHGHDCEGIAKFSRTLRQQIPETCKEIRNGTLNRMQSELENIKSLQNKNKKVHEEELNSMEMLQERCILTVKTMFKTKVEKSSDKLCKHNEKLNAREQELIQKIEKLNVHVQAHQDSHLTYGKYEIIEMDKQLKEITRGYDEMDIKENVYVSSAPSNLSPDQMERLESCVQSILLEFSEGGCERGNRRRSRQLHIDDVNLSNTSQASTVMEPISMVKVEGTCVICMDNFIDPQKLKKCGHIFCKECIEQYFSGYKPSCPNCGMIYGKITGNQPEGKITIAKDMTRLPGYDRCTSIKVTYSFLDGKQGFNHPSPGTPYSGIVRSGYLPDNTEGRLVAKLLNVAFTRKLVFTIGRSRITGHDGVLTWNDIHHKTRIHGGTDRFGYPDPTYIERVMDELSVKGVTEESADDPSEYTEYSKVFS